VGREGTFLICTGYVRSILGGWKKVHSLLRDALSRWEVIARKKQKKSPIAGNPDGIDNRQQSEGCVKAFKRSFGKKQIYKSKERQPGSNRRDIISTRKNQRASARGRGKRGGHTNRPLKKGEKK